MRNVIEMDESGTQQGDVLPEEWAQEDDISTEISVEIQKLKQAMLNEKFSPEILPFEKSLVQELKEVIEVQDGLIDEEELGTLSGPSRNSLGLHLRKVEIGRVKYLLRAYLRSRLLKIEHRAKRTLHDELYRSRLSPDELKYAENFLKLMEAHFQSSFLQQLPEKLRSVDDRDGDVDMNPGPALNRFVFCHVKKNVGTTAISDDPTDQALYLGAGDVYCLRYKPVRDLVESGSVDLL